MDSAVSDGAADDAAGHEAEGGRRDGNRVGAGHTGSFQNGAKGTCGAVPADHRDGAGSKPQPRVKMEGCRKGASQDVLENYHEDCQTEEKEDLDAALF